MLGVIPVKVWAHGGEIDTYAFLDNGSDVTLVTKDLLSSLGLEGTPSSMTLTTINGASQVQGNMCELEVTSMDENEMIRLDRVFALPSLPVNAPSLSISQEARRWPHLQESPFRELDDKRVTVLIGSDVPEAHWVLDQRLGSRKQPYAIKTFLGWVLLGPLHGNTKRGTVNYARISEESIKDDVRRLYEAEFKDTEENEHSFSIEDRKATELVTQSTVLEKGHYIIPLPWKDPAKEPTTTSRLINGDTVKVERTLGLEWNSEIDCFVFPFKIPLKPVTRRGILSAVSSIFDPLGMLSPLLIPTKLMLQSLCKQNTGWDQSLSSQNEEVR
ncbi:unnamed protein product [Trichobilharzia regenti]|nr:unnamed protein product [Trichobilharzia regenti]